MSITKKFCANCEKEVSTDLEACPDCGSPLAAISTADLIGVVVDGRYTITDVLGRGGMGVVYRARQAYLDRDVALKVMRRDLSEDTDMIRRFLQEAKAASKLTSPHTVTIHDFGLTPDGQMYFTMELLQGISLGDLLKAEGTLPYPRAVRLAVQCCHSLTEAHRHGIWHRDMKPENVIVTRGKRDQDHVKILDFGIAKVRGDNQAQTQTGLVFGSPRYLSPEQTNNLPLDHRTDIYSLGVMLYELLLGEAPFDGESTVSLLMNHVQKPPPPFAEKNPAVEVSQALEDVVQWSLAKRPDDRPASAEAFANALQEAIGENSDTGVDARDDDAFTAPPGAGDSVPIALPWEEETQTGDGDTARLPLMTAEIDRVVHALEERTSAGETIDSLDEIDDELTKPGAFRADHRRNAAIAALVLVTIIGLVALGLWQPWAVAPPPADDDVTEAVDLPPAAAPVPDVVSADTPPEATPAPDVAPEIAAEIVPEDVREEAAPIPDLGPEIVPDLTPEIVPDVTPEIVPDVAPEVVLEDIAEKKDPPKKDPPKKDPPKKDPPKKDPPKKDPPKKDPPKKDPPKKDPPKEDPPKKDPEDEYTEIPLGL